MKKTTPQFDQDTFDTFRMAQDTADVVLQAKELLERKVPTKTNADSMPYNWFDEFHSVHNTLAEMLIKLHHHYPASEFAEMRAECQRIRESLQTQY